MKRKASLPILALLALALAAPVVAAQDASTASILFTRNKIHPEDSTRSSSLYRVNPSGGRGVPLTPWTLGVDYRSGSWSPNGSSVVYEQVHQLTPDHTQLFVVDRQGSGAHRITSGPYRHQQPSWGPGSTIAFVTDMGDQQCLSVVKASGKGQRDLFCPIIYTRPSTPPVMSTPQWTADGKSLLIEIGAYARCCLEPYWVSRVYRVDAATGTAVRITRQEFDDRASMTLSPDGTHGVYAYNYSLGSMILVDYANDTRTLLPAGFVPRYSRDGSRIAFVRHAAASTDFWNGTVYVMNADGSDAHPAVGDPDPDAAYSIGDWSRDGSRILLDKVDDQHLMQIVDLATGAATTVSKGTAGKGAWFDP